MRWLLAAAISLSAGAALADAGPADIWRKGAANSARHLQSGLICPADLGGMERVTVAAFDEAGRDVACGYVGDQVGLTLYLKAGGAPAPAMAAAKAQLLAAAEGAAPVLLREDEIRDGDLTWLRASYDEGAGVRSDIWITALSGWTLKYRTTYGQRQASAAARAVEAVSRAVTASAGPQLAHCVSSGAAVGC